MFGFMKKTATSVALAVAAFVGTGAIAPVSAQDAMLGEVKFFAGNFAPRGWALCDGQLLSIAQNTALFSILGTTYGGDGRTTFGLPDMRGRNPMHAGAGAGLAPVRLGQRAGAATVALNQNNLPSHSHSASNTVSSVSTLHAVGAGGTTNAPSGALLSDDGSDRIYSAAAADVQMNAEAVTTATTVTTSIGATGGSQAFSVQDPYVAVNCIIALQGFFPSRN